jgi:imidazolonepropionase-like amidohydrolase
MRRVWPWIVLSVGLPFLLSIAAGARQGGTPQSTASQAAVAIRNVTVIPATGAAPITGATVVIIGDRISALGPASSTVIPKQARIVDGAGKFLMPGLIEMHAHVSKARASSLGLFVANGVTTLRDMGGDHEELLRWRREIRAGSRIGPRMFIAGPYLEAARNIERMRKDPPSERVEPFERLRIPIATPDDARRVIGELANKEVDFLKIRTVQDEATYLALNEAAHAHTLRLTGHVGNLNPATVFKAGQDDIEHGFYPPITSGTRAQRIAMWRGFAERGVIVVPTMVVAKDSVLAPIDHLSAMMDDPGGKIEPRRPYVSRFCLKDWREQLSETTPERQKAYHEIAADMLTNLREMHEAGVELLAGSDVAVINIFPGSSLHRELELFVSDLKMTPSEAIERATRRSAKWLGIEGETGTVEQGKVADLMLLDANPLQDIRNTRRIAGVFLRGAFYDRAGIDGLLEKVKAAEDITVDDWGRK